MVISPIQPDRNGGFVTKSELEDLQVHLDEKFFLVDRRFAETDKKIEAGREFTEDAFFGLEKVMNMRFDEVDKRFNAVDQRFDRVDERFDRLEGQFDKLEGRFGGLEGRFDKLEGRFDRLEGRFDRLEGEFGDIKIGLKRLETAVQGMSDTLKKR